MSEHREWSAEKGMGLFSTEIAEHNATVRAYRDAMAECDRLGKANDEACDRIADLEREWQHAKDNCHDGIEYTESLKKDFFEMEEKLKALESRPVLTWEECEEEFYHVCGHFPNSSQGSFMGWLKSRLPAPTDSIRVPFSDAQIEAMAKAADECYSESWGTTWPDAIRAALAAGGLEPCAVPEYAPEDVAFSSERRTDADLSELFYKMTNCRENDDAKPWTDSKYVAAMTTVRKIVEKQTPVVAVPDHIVDANKMVPERASVVELREIGVDAYLSHDTAKRENAGCMVDPMQAATIAVRARVEAPLLAEIARLEASCAWNKQAADSLRAELESVTAERDANVKSREIAIDSIRRLEFELAALRQRDTVPVKVPAGVPDVDELAVMAEHTWLNGSGDNADRYMRMTAAIRDAVLRGMGAEPEREEWIGDPEPNSDDVAAVYDEDDATFSHVLYEMIKNTPRPTALERRTMMAHCTAMWRAYHKALSNQYPTPREPTDPEVEALNNDSVRFDLTDEQRTFILADLAVAQRMFRELTNAIVNRPAPVWNDEQIEALARVLCDDCNGAGYWPRCTSQDSWRKSARAAVGFMRVGPPVAGVDPDMWKTPLEIVDSEGDTLTLGVYKEDIHLESEGVFLSPDLAARVATHLASYAAAHGCPVGLPQLPEGEVTHEFKPVTGFEMLWNQALAEEPIASPDVLEQLAEIGLAAYYASAPDNCKRKFSEISEACQKDTLAQVAAILRAAQAYVDVNPGWQMQATIDSFGLTCAAVDYLNSRIRYRVALPETPKGLPSAEELAMGIDWKSFCCNATSGEPCTLGCDKAREFVAQHILAALRPWLHEPTGWELDVTAELAAKMLQDMKASYCEKTSYSTWDQLGENYKEDFIKVFGRFLPSLASRIRPTFECAECERLRGRLRDVSAYFDKTAEIRDKQRSFDLAARAALEGE